MTIVIAVPKGLWETKPKHGEPCTSCGICCRAALCHVASALFIGIPMEDVPGPCPALLVDKDGKSGCGLVLAPEEFCPVGVALYGAEEMGRAAALLINAGNGCDMSVPGDFNEGYDARMESESRREAPRRRLARKMWGMP